MKQKVQNTRIALSKQGARFELPIDMKSLESKLAQIRFETKFIERLDLSIYAPLFLCFFLNRWI